MVCNPVLDHGCIFEYANASRINFTLAKLYDCVSMGDEKFTAFLISQVYPSCTPLIIWTLGCIIIYNLDKNNYGDAQLPLL